VSNGSITLTEKASTVHAGFGYVSDLKMLRIEAGAADGTALGKTRRINRLGILFHRSLGLQIGARGFDGKMFDIVFRTGSDSLSRAVPLFSGIKSETLAADYDFENQVCLRQSQPLPTTILAIMPQMNTQDR
jgi:hypothetical protein